MEKNLFMILHSHKFKPNSDLNNFKPELTTLSSSNKNKLLKSFRFLKNLALSINFRIIVVSFVFNFALCNPLNAEVIDVKSEEKSFGDWKVFCETDDMIGASHCKIAAKFFDNSCAITIEPSNKFANQFFIVIPKIQIGSFLKIRVDQNDFIISRNVVKKDFGLIQIDEQKKHSLFLQMKEGDFLFLRFNIVDSEKEVTAKLSLSDFKNALIYYKSKTLK